MAHLRKRGNNTWQICIEKGRDPMTGKRQRVYKTVKGTKKEAEKEMHRMAYEIENGAYIEPSELNVREMLLWWYDDYAKNNLAPSTQEYYDVIINSHLVPFLGNIKISDLQPFHIQNYISKKLNNGRLDGKEGGLSKKSVKRHYTVLNQVLKYAFKLQIIDRNPADPISPPAPKKPEIKAMRPEDLNKLLDAATAWLYDFLYIAAFTGMRRGELLGLRWQDVDFKEKILEVKQSAVKLSGGRLIFREPKTRSSIRPINVDDDIINILRRRNKEQKEDRLKLGSAYNKQYNLVFRKENGDPYLPLYATKQFNKLAQKVNLSNFRLHDLRHTHATLMLKADVHPKIVQERLGHSSITQTLDTYSHVIPSMQKEAIQKLKNSLKK